MGTFQNRELEIDKICSLTDQAPPLLTVFGEAGIGKTSLLEEAAKRLRAASPPAVVLMVDLGLLEDIPPAERPEAVLRKLNEEAQEWTGRGWPTGADITSLTEKHRLFLMLDTTETLQEDMSFWSWVEEYLIRPLAIERDGRVVFAGRIPPPLRRIEVRRNLEQLRLKPLSPQDAARSLVKEVLEEYGSPFEDEESSEKVVDLVLDFSFGHPQLSERVAQHIAEAPPNSLNEAFCNRLCKKIVVPFVNNELFDGIEEKWREILWWLSILDRFDPTIMQMYLSYAAPELVAGKPDYYFIQRITHLRIRNTVIWREGDGDSLHGVIRPILRHCLKISEPERYKAACRAAAATFSDLGRQFPEGSSEAQYYFQKSEEYQELLTQEGA